MGDPVGRGQVPGLTDPHAEAVDAVSARPNEDRPFLTDQPGAEPAALQGQPALGEQLPLVMADEVTEQPERRLLRLFCRHIADRLHAAGASPGLQMKDGYPMAEEDRRD